MAFEKFNSLTRKKSPMFLSVTTSGQLYFSVALANQLCLAEKPFVDFYYDKDSGLIGMKFLREMQDGAYSVFHNHRSWIVNAQKVWKYNNIVYPFRVDPVVPMTEFEASDTLLLDIVFPIKTGGIP